MKIKFLKNTVAGGTNRYAGDIMDIEGEDALFLCAIGKAEPADGAGNDAPVSAPEVETKMVETRKIKRRRRV